MVEEGAINEGEEVQEILNNFSKTIYYMYILYIFIKLNHLPFHLTNLNLLTLFYGI